MTALAVTSIKKMTKVITTKKRGYLKIHKCHVERSKISKQNYEKTPRFAWVTTFL